MQERSLAATAVFRAIVFVFAFPSGGVLFFLLAALYSNDFLFTAALGCAMLALILGALATATLLAVSPMWVAAGAVAGFLSMIGWLAYAFRDFGE